MNTSYSGTVAAGVPLPVSAGPIGAGRRLYKVVSIVTLLMMVIGGFAMIPTDAGASPSGTSAELNVHAGTVDAGAYRTIGAVGGGTVHAQSVSTLIDRLVAILQEILAQDGGSVAPPANDESGIIGIIYAAADRYGQPREDMLRVARCESNLNPNAVNPTSQASGLFQFLPSTWETTPYADQNIFDPVANANAAAWMWDNGRRNEWVCQ